jgi:hypothetical protein
MSSNRSRLQFVVGHQVGGPEVSIGLISCVALCGSSGTGLRLVVA